MGKGALMTVHGKGAPPTLAEAAAQLGVHVSALNPDFGVILIDPDREIYTVEVDVDQTGGIAEPGDSFGGPYSNPDIEPLG
jgi:hypothetical protein